MIRYECDRCRRRLGANDSQRYIVKIEIYAAAGPEELTLQPSADPAREFSNVLQALSKADPNDIEDKTYRMFRFDVCDSCRQILLQRPLGT